MRDHQFVDGSLDDVTTVAMRPLWMDVLGKPCDVGSREVLFSMVVYSSVSRIRLSNRTI